MFRKYFVLIILPLVVACEKENNVPEIQQPVIYHKVPHMVADTLISTTQKNNTFVYDTVYTDADLFNTYIYYKGNVYTLKAIEERDKKFSDSLGIYKCDMFDANNAKLNTEPITATSSQWYNTVYKEIEKTRQTLTLNFSPFPADAGVYKGRQ